ncbi:DNA circularization protein [Bordetella bronchiseptica]|uniref:DNA circularization protein n=1 Tax=Bordetella bronchiseptica TaxID=518 RepID=UPI000461B706|nr:DNA circularization N-terminal domain-containing protein [Bordetella bronchiseptica]KDC65722.1 DNA circularization protein N-terminal domain protein [Bordetella bronchiseptica MBORD591]
MSWKDNLLDASFKGVKFDCVRTREVDERDVAEYLYPYLDGGDTDDLGRGIRRFDITAVFWGDDYETRLQAFLAKLEEPGPGELIHPIYGSIKYAQLKGKAVDHDADDPDYATLRMTFLEHKPGNPFFVRELPAQKADAASQYADLATELGTSQFASYLSTLKAKPGILSRLNAMRDVMAGTLSSIRGVVDSWVSAGMDLVEFPRAFVADLSSGVSGLLDLRALDGDGLMPNWRGLAADAGSVIRLPKGVSSGNVPDRFVATKGSAGAVPMEPADLVAIEAVTQVAVAASVAEKAADVLAGQAENPTLAPAEVEQIANDVRELIQDAVDTYRDNFPPDVALPICDSLRDAAKSIQDAAIEVINLRPPLQRRVVETPANLRLLAFQWYGDHNRATELARLNPTLRNPNDIRAGDTLNGFAR